MTDVALDYRVPPEDLQPYVTLFYHFCADVPMFEDVERVGTQWLVGKYLYGVKARLGRTAHNFSALGF